MRQSERLANQNIGASRTDATAAVAALPSAPLRPAAMGAAQQCLLEAQQQPLQGRFVDLGAGGGERGPLTPPLPALGPIGEYPQHPKREHLDETELTAPAVLLGIAVDADAPARDPAMNSGLLVGFQRRGETGTQPAFDASLGYHPAASGPRGHKQNLKSGPRPAIRQHGRLDRMQGFVRLEFLTDVQSPIMRGRSWISRDWSFDAAGWDPSVDWIVPPYDGSGGLIHLTLEDESVRIRPLESLQASVWRCYLSHLSHHPPNCARSWQQKSCNPTLVRIFFSANKSSLR